jgi:predicted RNA-binding Zn-ribbon protein involved in translation (DUF1610 family)
MIETKLYELEKIKCESCKLELPRYMMIDDLCPECYQWQEYYDDCL